MGSGLAPISSFRMYAISVRGIPFSSIRFFTSLGVSPGPPFARWLGCI